MDLRQLRYFVAIVEAGSFSRAALALRIAQPALSLHVRNMETDLGAELLLRTPQGVVPTAAGQILLERARALVADFEDLKLAVAEHDSEPAGEVRLGLPGTIGDRLSVPLILRAREKHPRIHLKVAEAMSGFVLDWLRDGRVDVGLLYLPVRERGLASVPLVEEELRLFGPAAGIPGVSAPAPGAVSLAEICLLPLVLPSQGHGLRHQIEAEVEAAGLSLSTVIEVDSYGAIKELVRERLGYSILPLSAVAAEAQAGRLRTWSVGQQPLTRQIHLARSTDRPAGKATVAIEALCREVLRDLVTSGAWQARSLAGGESCPVERAE